MARTDLAGEAAEDAKCAARRDAFDNLETDAVAVSQRTAF
jgi:hypothetical protein